MSQPEKLTILVDLDGPLADFDRAFHELCQRNGWTMDCTPDTQRHRFATDHIPNVRARELAREAVQTPGWFRNLPVVAGALDGLQLLDEKHDVWVVSKPLEANPTCRDEKAAWLIEHFGHYWERRLILTNDKSMVRGDVLLDDAPHLDWLERAEWVPVIFTMPWNGPGSKWERFQHWSWGDRENLLDVNRLVEALNAVARSARRVGDGLG